MSNAWTLIAEVAIYRDEALSAVYFDNAGSGIKLTLDGHQSMLDMRVAADERYDLDYYPCDGAPVKVRVEGTGNAGPTKLSFRIENRRPHVEL